VWAILSGGLGVLCARLGGEAIRKQRSCVLLEWAAGKWGGGEGGERRGVL